MIYSTNDSSSKSILVWLLINTGISLAETTIGAYVHSGVSFLQWITNVHLWDRVTMEEFVKLWIGSISVTAPIQITMDQIVKQVHNTFTHTDTKYDWNSVDLLKHIFKTSWEPMGSSRWLGHSASAAESQSGCSDSLCPPQRSNTRGYTGKWGI